MNKVAIYMRYNKSVEDMQLEGFLEYAKEKELDLYKVYSDICSGYISSPPALTNLINDSNKFDTLLVYSLDRISRSANIFYDVKNKLRKANVNIISLKEGVIL